MWSDELMKQSGRGRYEGVTSVGGEIVAQDKHYGDGIYMCMCGVFF